MDSLRRDDMKPASSTATFDALSPSTRHVLKRAANMKNGRVALLSLEQRAEIACDWLMVPDRSGALRQIVVGKHGAWGL